MPSDALAGAGGALLRARPHEGRKESSCNCEDYEERLSHPLAIQAARWILTNPRCVLYLILFACCAAAVGALELGKIRGKAEWYGLEPLTAEFPQRPRHQDALVLWCHARSAEEESCGQQGAEAVVLQHLRRMRGDEACADLEWSSASAPRPTMGASEYISGGVRMVEMSSASKDCMSRWQEELAGLAESVGGGVEMALGGPESVTQASMAAAGKEAWNHCLCAVPVIAGILMLALGNCMRPLTAVVCMAVTFMSTRAVLFVVKALIPALNIDLEDQGMFFIAFALNADYALFFWSRFAEERAHLSCKSQYVATLEESLLRSGTVILVSNFVMAAATLGTLLLPELNLNGQSAFLVECFFGISFAGLYSLTLTPALAAAFPALFDDEGGKPSCAARARAYLPDPKRFWVWWARVITSRPWRYVAPILVFLCMAPLLVALSQYRPNLDVLEDNANHRVKEYQAYKLLEGHFNIGRVMPIEVVLEARDLGPAPVLELLATPRRGVTSPMFAASSREGLLQDVGNVDGGLAHATNMLQLGAASVIRREQRLGPQAAGREEPHQVAGKKETGAAVVAGDGARLDLDRLRGTPASSVAFGRLACRFVEGLMNATRGSAYQIGRNEVVGAWWLPGFGCSAEVVSGSSSDGLLGKLEQGLAQQAMLNTTSLDGTKQLLSIFAAFAPTSDVAVSFSRLVRDEVEPSARQTFEFEGRLYEFSARHRSVMSKEIDRSRLLQAAAPRVFGLVLIVGFLGVGWTFQSAFLPVKLALTVAVPLAATYGFVVALFQLGWFGQGLTIEGGKGIDDMLPFTTPTMLFGLAMDYDLFLFVRVYEYRRKRYDNISAVKRALVETGPVITMAGLLMAASLFFMAISETPFMKVMGTTYVTGVCFDVFVVRTVVAPAVLSMAEHLNYWPSEMPPAAKSWDGPDDSRLSGDPSALKSQ